ncbi:Protein CutA 1, chloroplastic [Ananas comosus]|uniref:Protein CutA 1, chloroplastic n=1 Tax=Ananas comosus TaxID=4615 RepID=A0A199VWG2_ANACO|nr:Protein CutA 1, chloroplastic [Ananas comosus]
MALQNIFRSLSISSPPHPRRPSSSPAPSLHYRAPLVRALCVLSIGAFTALACKTGCAHSQRRLSFLGSRFGTQASATGMAAESSTVPSIVVYVTVPNREAGKKLSESIIKERLAACVNIVPGIESIYWWEGKVQSDSEELLIIKTRESLLDALTEHVKANHEYEVPEVIALPINGGNLKYLEWLKNSTREK